MIMNNLPAPRCKKIIDPFCMGILSRKAVNALLIRIYVFLKLVHIGFKCLYSFVCDG